MLSACEEGLRLRVKLRVSQQDLGIQVEAHRVLVHIYIWKHVSRKFVHMISRWLDWAVLVNWPGKLAWWLVRCRSKGEEPSYWPSYKFGSGKQLGWLLSWWDFLGISRCLHFGLLKTKVKQKQKWRQTKAKNKVKQKHSQKYFWQFHLKLWKGQGSFLFIGNLVGEKGCLDELLGKVSF